MSEYQSNQPIFQQPDTEAVSQETTETYSAASETQPQEQPITENESGVPKPGFGQQVFGLVRSFLPESVNQKLSDRLLTGAITAIFVLILVIIFVSFSSNKPTTEVADISVVESQSTEAIAMAESLLSKENEEISDLTLPEAPDFLESIVPEPPKLTPEQVFLVSIQNQIDDLVNEYGGGIVESLKFDFPINLLIAEVSDSWYEMTQEEQDKLVTQMFEEVQDLDFAKLALINSQGRIVARTSVINSKMVILQRLRLIQLSVNSYQLSAIFA
ncbi:hypothetical protein [Okeania sp.]|uniref:hypothetical protein n=1 Tax=Okeania sp. TaxID=3100323 RepID=UPI002B4AEAE0|nr:hypothetical protein [Okeania sp.]MEB3340374.1 hypothetical protein [Okeania sp.]